MKCFLSLTSAGLAMNKTTHPQVSSKNPKRAEAVTFDGETWKAVVCGVLQRPDFNSKGAALVFAQQVFTGLRDEEPVR
jgi:hypothetical protein